MRSRDAAQLDLLDMTIVSTKGRATGNIFLVQRIPFFSSFVSAIHTILLLN